MYTNCKHLASLRLKDEGMQALFDATHELNPPLCQSQHFSGNGQEIFIWNEAADSR